MESGCFHEIRNPLLPAGLMLRFRPHRDTRLRPMRSGPGPRLADCRRGPRALEGRFDPLNLPGYHWVKKRVPVYRVGKAQMGWKQSPGLVILTLLV